MKNNLKFLPFASLFATALSIAGSVQADEAAKVCHLGRLATYSDRIHIRCVDGDFWYVARTNDHPPEFINYLVRQAATAIATGKSVRITYDPATETNHDRDLASLEIFH